MAPTTNKRGKQQTRLSFKTVRQNAGANVKPTKPALVTAAALKAAPKSKVGKGRATRASDVSSVEPNEDELEDGSEPEETELDFVSVRYITPLSHKSWLVMPLVATFDAS